MNKPRKSPQEASELIAQKPTKINLLRFTFPTILSMIIMNTFGIVDGIFVSRLIGQFELGAVGLVWPFISFVMAIGFMLGVGGNAMIAKKIGECKEKEGRENFSMIVVVAFIASIVVAIVGLVTPDLILRILGVNEFMRPMALEYMQPIIFFIPLAVLGMVFQQFLITAGKAQYSAYMSLASGVLSAGLNYVFIHLLGWGLRGAALATGIGMIIPFSVGLLYFMLVRSGNLYLVRPRWDIRALGRSVINGASEMITMLAASITAVLMNNVLMDIDHTGMAVASATIMWSGMGIFASLFAGYSSGVAPIISYNYGSDNKVYLRRAFRNSLRLIGFLAVIAIALSLSTINVLLWVYSVPSYLPLHEMVRNGYLFIVAAFLMMGFNGFGTMFFTALNNGVISSVLSVFNGIIFYLIALYIFSSIFGLNGVWASVPMAEALQVFLTVFFLVKMRKRYGYA